MMRLMLREHLPLLILYSIQTVVIPIIYWLDGYHNLWLFLYVMVLSYSLLIGYLCYRFLSHVDFYTVLSSENPSLNGSISSEASAPIAIAFKRLLSHQYQLFQHDLHQYKERLDRQITFINQWVHQMKTPLSVIDMILQTEDHPTFNRIHIEMERLKKGLEMVLYTSRLDHFEHDFYVERLDLQQVVKRVMRENKSMFIYHHVYPQMSIDEKVFVYSDEKWIAFVFSQLLTNAVKYTGGQENRIDISIYRQRDETIFEVKDHGIGIPKRDRQRVFEPYFTGQQGRMYSESTGMGLYLAKEICQRLNHQIELESEAGVGTGLRGVGKQPYSIWFQPLIRLVLVMY